MAVLAWFLARPARLVAGVLAIGILTVRLELAQRAQHKAEAAAAASRLAYTNVLAHEDTTRELFHDSLAGYTHMAEQMKVEGHARLEAEGREAKARADLQLEVDSLHQLVERPVTVDSADVRSTRYETDSTSAIHLVASVKVPPPPTPASWDVSLSLAPAFLTLELACQGDQARADVVGPSWLKVQLDHVQQDPRICSKPEKAVNDLNWIQRHVSIGVMVGPAVVRSDGWRAGLGGMIGLSYRP